MCIRDRYYRYYPRFVYFVNICCKKIYPKVSYDVKLTNKAGESASLPELMDMDVNTEMCIRDSICTASKDNY